MMLDEQKQQQSEVRRMLRMDQYELIRTAHRVYGKNISEIVRETGHARNTVKKALRGEYCGYRKRQSQPYPTLGPYLTIIDDWLLSDKEEPKKQRHTAHRIYERLVEEYSFSGSEPTVRRYVREAKARLGLHGQGAFIPLEPDVGREAEIDWGTAIAVLDGERRKIKYFCMRSKYSGKHFVRCYFCERQQVFFDAHLHAFDFFGGIFPVFIYDNLTTAVRKILRGRSRQEQESYVKFRAYHSFEARFCNPAQGHEKGGVEGIVGYARRNYLVPVPEAESLEALNRELLEKCLKYGNHQIHGRTKPVNELFEQERPHLIDFPEVRFRNVQSLRVKVDKYATVHVDHNRYSVPTEYVGFKVQALLDVSHVRVYYAQKELASHERVYGKDKWILSVWHYLELLGQRPQAFDSARPMKQWRTCWPSSLEALLERFCQSQGQSRGIKDFINVLLLYRDHPVGEVEAAVELALEYHLSASAGVKHLLLHSGPEPSVESLSQWSSLPPPDISAYGQLQATAAPTFETGGGFYEGSD
jgi:transposase